MLEAKQRYETMVGGSRIKEVDDDFANLVPCRTRVVCVHRTLPAFPGQCGTKVRVG